MKLAICVTHYDEPQSVVKPLLDSIAVQENINFDDIQVIIVNDGEKAVLKPRFLNHYNFPIEYHIEPHRGISGARNSAFNYAVQDGAEYVMFCDCDDAFYSTLGLWLIMGEIDKGGFDSFYSIFAEEVHNAYDGTIFYKYRESDATFVHGKVHRVQYLLDKNIRWNENLTCHEDSFFNALAQKCTNRLVYCQTPFYLWKWRADSICRKSQLYLLETYTKFIDSNDALITEFLARGLEEDAKYYSFFLIYDAYLAFNHAEWLTENALEQRKINLVRFNAYFQKYKALAESLDIKKKIEIAKGLQCKHADQGLLFIPQTFFSFYKEFSQFS